MVPEVLVVLPTLGDRIESLGETLRSVDAQRADVPLRLVVIAPSTAVEARALAAKHGAEIVDDARTGLAGAMNAGLAARRGEKYYVGLGDDDLLRPGGIRLLLEQMGQSQQTVVSYGACDYIDEQSRIIGTNNAGWLAHRILRWGPNLVPHPGTLIDLDALVAVGGFDETLRYTMDLDAFLKLKRVGKFAASRESVSAFRWHADSLTVADRYASAKQAREVKKAHTPRGLRWASNLWLAPIEWATSNAGKVVSKRSRFLSTTSPREPSESGSGRP